MFVVGRCLLVMVQNLFVMHFNWPKRNPLALSLLTRLMLLVQNGSIGMLYTTFLYALPPSPMPLKQWYMSHFSLVQLPCECSEVSGDREVQRTMLELLNQLDGFSSDERIKVPFWISS